MAVGNPPQYFTDLIDTGFSDSIFPLANCTEPGYCDKHPLYNSPKSSTYMPNGTAVHIFAGLFHTWGNASVDFFHIGGIEIQHQIFEEATLFRPTWIFPDSWHDATLPLSREIVFNPDETDLNVPSPFQNMVKQGLLKVNEFSL